MITDDFGVDPDLPVFEDPSRYTYIRPHLENFSRIR